ncbi:hypothetical protein PENTCL1PPCAC_20778 [Pristionchus entomophagus]|uniref:Small ribosomal subunit protein uS15m n=1 Tax=Pristionchus entomophagus TaxID=358040 RepID=A0AAV5TWK2_9BILA|nr:hypothetical protein PENTCL1PPCAC_20778 [Pristionchus entomophagus]
MMQRRALHLSASVFRGRSFFFNKHKKVTDPEYQEEDFFERKARELPLDEHYIDALKKLYEEKVGAERDLGLKAADNLVADRITFGLPDLDLKQPRGPYRGLDELKNAPDSVKKIFSLEMGTRRERTEAWKRELIERCSLHSIDGDSLEMKIAWTTALIRHWSMLADDIAKETPKKPTWLTHRIWLVINWRRKMLGQLRDQNRENFDRILAELKIAYHVPKQPEHVKTRKAWAEAQLRSRVEEEKEKRLEALHVKYTSERESHLEAMRARREELEKGIADIDRQLHEITVFEDGEERPSDKQYQQALVGELTEKVIHQQLFYHPKPTMTRNV